MAENNQTRIYEGFPLSSLIEFAKYGDSEAWKELIHGQGIFFSQSLFVKMTKRANYKLRVEAYADDVVQETTVDMFRGIAGFEFRADFSTWCIGILNKKIKAKQKELSREVDYSKLKVFLLDNKVIFHTDKNNQDFNELIQIIDDRKLIGKRIEVVKINSLLKSLSEKIKDAPIKSKVSEWIRGIDEKFYGEQRIPEGTDADSDDEDFAANENFSGENIDPYGPEESLTYKQLLQKIESIVKEKYPPPSRELEIVYLKIEGVSQTDIAVELSLTDERVSVIWKKIKSILKHELSGVY